MTTYLQSQKGLNHSLTVHLEDQLLDAPANDSD
jgi:hypothetical protein